MDLAARKARLEREQERVRILDAATEVLPQAVAAVEAAETTEASAWAAYQQQKARTADAVNRVSELKQLLGIPVRPKAETPPATEKAPRRERRRKGEASGEVEPDAENTIGSELPGLTKTTDPDG